MPNRFVSGPAQNGGPFSNTQDVLSQFNSCKANPAEFLAQRGIQVPQEYANNPQMMAQYLLSQTPVAQRSGIFSMANMLKSMLMGR